MKKDVEAVEWVCDGCGKVAVTSNSHDDAGPTGWIIGTAGRDGYGGEWQACRPACVRTAVIETVTFREGVS